MIHAILISVQLLLHPFHVSVTEIKFKEDSKAIQISSRIFLDDLEETLQSYTGNEALDITDASEWDFIETNLKKYFFENLKLSDEKGELETKYVGAEIENDVMWIYVEILKVKKLKSIRVKNSLLTDEFEDQENIIHFRAYDKVKSTRLYRGDDVEVFDWVE